MSELKGQSVTRGRGTQTGPCVQPRTRLGPLSAREQPKWPPADGRSAQRGRRTPEHFSVPDTYEALRLPTCDQREKPDSRGHTACDPRARTARETVWVSGCREPGVGGPGRLLPGRGCLFGVTDNSWN